MAEGDNDLRIEPEDASVAFRAEMWASDFLLRYWMQLAGVTVFFLVSVAIYGQYDASYTRGQRATTKAVADIEQNLDMPVSRMGIKRVTDQELDVAKLSEAASELVSTGASGTGAAAFEANIKAAELYRLADDAAGRRKALEAAASDSTGVLRYAALAGLAALDIEQDNIDAGLDRYRQLTQDADAYLAQQATLDLASAQEAVGRGDDAVATYDGFLAKWPEATLVEEIQTRRDRAAGKTAE